MIEMIVLVLYDSEMILLILLIVHYDNFDNHFVAQLHNFFFLQTIKIN